MKVFLFQGGGEVEAVPDGRRNQKIEPQVAFQAMAIRITQVQISMNRKNFQN